MEKDSMKRLTAMRQREREKVKGVKHAAAIRFTSARSRKIALESRNKALSEVGDYSVYALGIMG
jgi:hypothetical protein